uniref:NADH-ubiquinone oxidoreductase chain 4L n=1 Tax=Archichauliodes deceptor TaxID=1909206 RepID=A0A343A2V1_9NEOP|nr:NADH dehydrogenase subunit 4L [Archichauliodes deceptor]AOX48545.1 NADH dehydrogenase subunit 4L [Archichauliodes deceptor]
MMIFDYFYVFMFMGGVWVFVSKRKHLLLMLLSLEFLVISLFMFLIVFLNNMNLWILFQYNIFWYLLYVSGPLGLGILVSMVRTHGNDYFSSFSVLKC